MNYISAEPIVAANMPTLSKPGESSQMHYTTPETRSAFNPSSSEHYKFWNPATQPSWNEGPSFHQLPPFVPEPLPDLNTDEMNDWLCFDDDFEMGSDLSSSNNTNLQWSPPMQASALSSTLRNPSSGRLMGSLPVLASHSSLQFNPIVFEQDGSSVHYPIDSGQANYDMYGSEPPFTFFDGQGHFPLELDLPHKPTSQLPPRGRPMLPPLLTIPDFGTVQYSAPGIPSNEFSPISPLSNFSSPSSSPSSSPELVIQTSIPLHQPRPQRRIPIVSLSALASACDEPSQLQPPDQKGLGELPSQGLLSPLQLHPPTEFSAPCLPPQLQPADPFVEHDRDRWKGPGTHLDNTRTGVIACACGCNAGYTLS